MPQFDSLSFYIQIVWFLVTFYAFYILSLKFLLVPLVRHIKFRKKLISYAKASESNNFFVTKIFFQIIGNKCSK